MEEICKDIQDIDKLRAWFSAARMARYVSDPDPAALYVWNERLSKAYLEEISYVEVLMRNFIADRLAADCERTEGDRFWYDHPDRYNLNDEFRKSVRKAKSRLCREGKAEAYDRVVAALTLDTRRFLLVGRLEPTVWRALRDVRNGDMPNNSGCRRADFEAHAAKIYALRNRCSHQEHLVMGDLEAEAAYLGGCSDALRWVSERIDPEAAAWIAAASRVAEVRARRPGEAAGISG